MWKVSIFGVTLVRIFPHLDWIRIDTPYLVAFSPNAGKCGPELLRGGPFLGSEFVFRAEYSTEHALTKVIDNVRQQGRRDMGYYYYYYYYYYYHYYFFIWILLKYVKYTYTKNIKI